VWGAAALVVAAAGACGGNKADTTIAVTGTDAKCDVADTSLSAGNIRFNLTNEGKKTTELYVLGEKDRIIDEIENISPGMTRALDVNLKAGTYTLACKPGQTGEGIRQKITVTGAGGETGAAAAKADRVIDVDATEYAFSFDETPTITKGEAIEFELSNKGKERHEFEVLGPDGEAIGEIPAIKGERKADAVFEFDAAGTYTYQCILKTAEGRTHKSLGMTGTFDVACRRGRSGRPACGALTSVA
jgi:plastocyanin